MGYAIDPRRKPAREIRRVLAEQLERLSRRIASAEDAATGFHGSRKGLKRMRAALLLLEGGVERRHWQPIFAGLGRIGRKLSPMRDLTVLGDTIRDLQAGDGNGRLALPLAVLRARLDARLATRGDMPPAAPTAAIQSELTRIGRRIARLPLRSLRRRQLAAAVATTYAAARKAMRAAYRTGEDQRFHDWRKHVQRHWRHLQLLEAAWPQEMAARGEAAARLGRLLGDDHDLTMLRDFIVADLQLARDPRMAAVLEVAAERQARLRAEARVLGGWLLSEKRSPFAARLRRYLRIARRARAAASAAHRPQPAVADQGKGRSEGTG